MNPKQHRYLEGASLWMEVGNPKTSERMGEPKGASCLAVLPSMPADRDFVAARCERTSAALKFSSCLQPFICFNPGVVNSSLDLVSASRSRCRQKGITLVERGPVLLR